MKYLIICSRPGRRSVYRGYVSARYLILLRMQHPVKIDGQVIITNHQKYFCLRAAIGCLQQVSSRVLIRPQLVDLGTNQYISRRSHHHLIDCVMFQQTGSANTPKHLDEAFSVALDVLCVYILLWNYHSKYKCSPEDLWCQRILACSACSSPQALNMKQCQLHS